MGIRLLTNKIKGNRLALFGLGRLADIGTTYANNPSPNGEFSPVGSFILQHGGFLSLFTINILICAAIYAVAKKMKLGFMIDLIIAVSFLIAIFNLGVYTYAYHLQ